MNNKAMKYQNHLVATWSPWRSNAEAYEMPPMDFVLSQSHDGRKFCHFGDNPWTFYDRPSSIKCSNSIHFHVPQPLPYYLVNDMLREQQSILLALERNELTSGKKPYALATLRKYSQILGNVAAYCALRQTSPFIVLASEAHCAAIFDAQPSNNKKAIFQRMLEKLCVIPKKYLGFTAAKIPEWKLRSGIISVPLTQLSQTEVIPTSIYASLLNGYKDVLKTFNNNRDALAAFAHDIAVIPGYGRNSKKTENLNFGEAADAHKVSEYCKKYNITESRGFARHIAMVQYCAIMTIYAFTGMRRAEAYSLSVDSLKRTISNNIVIKRELFGFTTKLNGGRKYVSWITSKDIELPFSTAEFLMHLIESTSGIDYNTARLLFISVAYLPFSPGQIKAHKTEDKEIVTSNLEPRHFQHLLPAAIITPEDILELERVDPHRVWRSEPDFAPGKHWPLAIHQVRRSTAIYAIRSGLVSLPALKSMLKHITTQMSVYYSRGASFAADFLSTEPNEPRQFIHDYRAGEDLVRAVQYTEELLLSDQPLKGPHGTWLELHSKPGLATVRYADLLAYTLKRVERGELVYRPTAPGGCTFNGVCEKRMMANLIACDGCKDSTVILKKVVRLIAVQTVLVNNCTPGTPEFQAEKEALDDLYAFSHKHGIASEAVGDSPHD